MPSVCSGVAAALREPGLGVEGPGLAAVRAASGAVRWTVAPAGPEAAGVPGGLPAPAAAAVGPMAVGADLGVTSLDTERCTETRPEAARGPDDAAPGLVGRDGAAWAPARPDGSAPATAPFDGALLTTAGPDGAPRSTVWLGAVSPTTV